MGLHTASEGIIEVRRTTDAAKAVGIPVGSRLSRSIARRANQGKFALPFALVLLLFFTLPPVALIWRWLRFGSISLQAVSSRSVVEATILSLSTTCLSMAIVLVFGTALAYVLAHVNFPLKRILTVFVEFPIVMPPAVAGLALLTAFGRQGLLGSVLIKAGVKVTFTPAAVVLAQVFVASPYYIRAVQTQLSAIPKEFKEAAGIDGAGSLRTFWSIIMPLSRRAALSSLSLTWARALGEFGATILVAGNLAGRTQTMTLLVYSALERDLGACFTVAVLLLIMAGTALGVVRYLAHLDQDADPLAAN